MRNRGGGAAARAADGNPLQMPLWAPQDASPGWHVRISRRARRLSMRVFPGGRVEVVVPPGIGIPAIERFVARHRDWAERRSREFALAAPCETETQPGHVALAASGQTWSIDYEPGRGRGVREYAAGALRVRVTDPGNRLQVSAALRAWLAERASDHLGRLLAEVSSKIEIDYRQLQLRRQ